MNKANKANFTALSIQLLKHFIVQVVRYCPALPANAVCRHWRFLCISSIYGAHISARMISPAFRHCSVNQSGCQSPIVSINVLSFIALFVCFTQVWLQGVPMNFISILLLVVTGCKHLIYCHRSQSDGQIFTHCGGLNMLEPWKVALRGVALLEQVCLCRRMCVTV